MIRYIDIDNTICQSPDDAWLEGLSSGYQSAMPIQSRIDIINKWYDDGDTIVYWTARGAKTKLDWRELTESQLKKWKCKYHELRLDKPLYDEFYDDRAFNAVELDKWLSA